MYNRNYSGIFQLRKHDRRSQGCQRHRQDHGTSSAQTVGQFQGDIVRMKQLIGLGPLGDQHQKGCQGTACKGKNQRIAHGADQVPANVYARGKQPFAGEQRICFMDFP